MLRSIIALALSLFIAAEASAQTTPATTKKNTAKASARQAKRATKKAARVARKATPAPAVAQAPLTDDGWPPIEPVAAVQAPATPAETPVHLRAEDVVYAGPGMAVRVQPNRLLPYSIRPPRKPASNGTTLAPVAANW
jgi:hypothetical protein